MLYITLKNINLNLLIKYPFMKPKTKKHLKNILYGFLAWLIPFVSSFFFYTKQGGLSIDIFLFKSIMIVIGSISAAFLLVSYFKKIKANYLKEAITVGIVWFIINIALDLLILIPMSGMGIADYFTQIGIRYLVIPAMAVMIGKALEDKAQTPESAQKKQNLKKLEKHIKKHDKITNNDVERILGVSNMTAWRYLEDMEKKGKIKQQGKTGKHTYYEKI